MEDSKRFEADDENLKQFFKYIKSVKTYLLKFFEFSYFKKYIIENELEVTFDNIYDIYFDYVLNSNLIYNKYIIPFIISVSERINDKVKLLNTVITYRNDLLIDLFKHSPYSEYLSSLDKKTQEILVLKMKALTMKRYNDNYISLLLKVSEERVASVSVDDMIKNITVKQKKR